MAHPLPTSSQYGVHLRSSSASGGKDWVGSVDNNNVMTSQWGKTGHINQHAEKKGGLPELTLLKHEKIQRGYVQVDEFLPNSGWQKSSSPPKHQPEEYKPA